MYGKLSRLLRNSVLSLSLLGLSAGCSSLDERVKSEDVMKSSNSSVSSSSSKSESKKDEMVRPKGVFGGFEMYDVMQRGELDTHMSDHAFGFGFLLGGYVNKNDVKFGPEGHMGFSFYPANDIAITEFLLGGRVAYCGSEFRPYASAGGMAMFHNRINTLEDTSGGGGCSTGCYYYKSRASDPRRRLNSAGQIQDTAAKNALGFYVELGFDIAGDSPSPSIGPFVRYTRAKIGDIHSRDKYGSNEIMIGLRIGGQ